ncbi:hypothetical protein Tco_1204344 [Tanacetum coccineum]
MLIGCDIIEDIKNGTTSKSTDNEKHKQGNTDKGNTYKDCINDSTSGMSKDAIEKKMGSQETNTYAEKAKGKRKCVKAPVKGSLSIDAPLKEKPVKGNVKALVKDNVVLNKSSVVLKEKPVKDNVKGPVKGNVKAPVKDKVEVSVLKGSLSVDVVPDDVVLNKSVGNVGKEKLPIVVKEKSTGVVYKSKSALSKDKLKQKVLPTVQGLSEVWVLRSSNQKDKPEVKSKVLVRVSRSKETPVKRKRNLLKEDDNKKKVNVKLLKGKSKKEDSNSEHETDEIVSSSDEVDHKPKKLKLKGWLNRKRNVSDSDSDSSSFNE